MSSEDQDITQFIMETEGVGGYTPSTEKTEEFTQEPEAETTETSEVAEMEKTGDVVAEEGQEVESVGSDDQYEELDLDSYIDEMSGGMFKSEEDFINSGIFDKASQYDQLLAEYEQLKDQGTPEPKFASDYVRELNEYIANGGTAQMFNEIVKADYDSVNDRDIVKMGFKAEFGISDQEAELLLNSRYKLDPDEYTEDEIKIAELNLKMDAKSHRETFTQKQQEAMTPNPENPASQGLTDEEASQMEAQRKDSWDGVVTDEVMGIDNLSFDNGFEYAISEEQKDALDDKIFDLIVTSGMEFTQDNIDSVKQMAMNQFIIDNVHEIVKAATDYANSESTKQKIKEDHNPSAVPSPEVRETGGKETLSDFAIRTIANAEGIKI